MFDRVMNGDQLSRNQRVLVAGISHRLSLSWSTAEGQGLGKVRWNRIQNDGETLLIRPMIGVVCSFGHASQARPKFLGSPIRFH